MDRLLQFDLLIIHVDADVAALEYMRANIVADNSDVSLPCEQPCPPPSSTTNALRQVVLSWCGESSTPNRTVLCVPSKSTEAWVVAMLFPMDSAVVGGVPFECRPNPAARLGQQSRQSRIKKAQRDYQDRSSRLEAEWPRICAKNGLSEAVRFRADITALFGALS